MVRTILLTALLVALAPSAAALAPLDPDSGLLADTLPDAPALPQAPALPALPASPDDLLAGAGRLAAPVEDLLACQQAVRVILAWYGARITDTRLMEDDFLAPYGWTEAVQQQVPIVRTVTETLWSAGPLGGLLEPVTRTVQEVTGYETVTREVAHSVDLAVHASWRESHLDWATYRDTFLLALPAGLPFVATGEGALTTACGEEVLTHVPDPDTSGVDVVCAACTGQPEDGWAIDVLSVRATLADADDYATLEGGDGAPAEVLEAVAQRGALLGLSALDDLRQDGERQKAGMPADAPAAPAPPVVPAAAVTVPLGTGLFLLVIIVVVVTLLWVGAIVVVARRRKE